MKKVVKKTIIIFCLFLILVVIAVAILGYLLNHGKFTRYVEEQVNKQIDGEVKFDTIFLDIFSGVVLKGVSFSEINNHEHISFRCKSLRIKGKISDLLTLRIKKIAIDDSTINANLEETDIFLTDPDISLNGTGDVSLDIKDVLPENLFIGEVSINNLDAQITANDYLFEMSEMDLQIKDVQTSKPLTMSIDGNVKITNRLKSESSNVSAEIGLKADYSLLRDELIILENSYLSLNNMGKFIINGRVQSVTSEPEISCNLKSQSFALNNIPDILKDFDFTDISPMTLEGKCDIDIFVEGNLDKITLESNSVVRDLNVTYDYKDWSCNGNISLITTIDTDNGKKQELDMVTNLSFSDVEFASPDYDYFGEGINGKIRLGVKSDYDFGRFSCKVNGKIDPFFISLGDFSTDMRNRVTEFSFESMFDIKKDLLSEINGTLIYDDIGSFVLNGIVAEISNTPQFDITLQMKDLSNSTFFETFVKDTIEYSSPQFFYAAIDGASNAYLNLSGNLDAIQIDGRLKVDDGHIKFGDTSIEGLYLDFPLSMTYPKAIMSVNKQDVPDNKYGSIGIRKLSYNFLEIDNFKVKPIVEGNNFFIKEPIEIPILGGTIFVKDIFVKDVINPDINFSFQLNNIDLEKVSNAANLTPFEGTLDTSLITFKQHDKKLFSDGEMKFTLFGGNIIINNLMLTDFMSALIGIEFSAKVNHLDLGQMSNTFREWGNVGGIINGKMDNFRIVAGEPSSFDIELRTEKKRGVKQVVSANFLKSFVPGIGSALDTFGFTSYNYAVMGLQARLENDYVTFKGAVRDKERELFMKGAGLKKLDIVFNNVDRNIKFSRFLGSFESIMKSNFDETKVEKE